MRARSTRYADRFLSRALRLGAAERWQVDRYSRTGSFELGRERAARTGMSEFLFWTPGNVAIRTAGQCGLGPMAVSAAR